MKKIILLVSFLCVVLGMIAQGGIKSIGINGVYMTEEKSWGIQAQMMFPVGKNFYIAPDVSYHFPITNSFGTDRSWEKIDISSKGLSYNVNFLYALSIGLGRSFISPMIGVGGLTAFIDSDWYNSSTTSFTCVVNFGLLGRFDLGRSLFISPQLRYLLPLKDGADGSFQIGAGLGIYF